MCVASPLVASSFGSRPRGTGFSEENNQTSRGQLKKMKKTTAPLRYVVSVYNVRRWRKRLAKLIAADKLKPLTKGEDL
jgi:hypothetical protein